MFFGIPFMVMIMLCRFMAHLTFSFPNGFQTLIFYFIPYSRFSCTFFFIFLSILFVSTLLRKFSFFRCPIFSLYTYKNRISFRSMVTPLHTFITAPFTIYSSSRFSFFSFKKPGKWPVFFTDGASDNFHRKEYVNYIPFCQ